jgi:hypothetical protein
LQWWQCFWDQSKDSTGNLEPLVRAALKVLPGKSIRRHHSPGAIRDFLFSTTLSLSMDADIPHEVGFAVVQNVSLV